MAKGDTWFELKHPVERADLPGKPTEWIRVGVVFENRAADSRRYFTAKFDLPVAESAYFGWRPSTQNLGKITRCNDFDVCFRVAGKDQKTWLRRVGLLQERVHEDGMQSLAIKMHVAVAASELVCWPSEDRPATGSKSSASSSGPKSAFPEPGRAAAEPDEPQVRLSDDPFGFPAESIPAATDVVPDRVSDGAAQ